MIDRKSEFAILLVNSSGCRSYWTVIHATCRTEASIYDCIYFQASSCCSCKTGLHPLSYSASQASSPWSSCCWWRKKNTIWRENSDWLLRWAQYCNSNFQVKIFIKFVVISFTHILPDDRQFCPWYSKADFLWMHSFMQVQEDCEALWKTWAVCKEEVY